MAGKPDAIIVGAVYQPGAEFIKLARKEGVIMTQVVPEMDDLSLPLTRDGCQVHRHGFGEGGGTRRRKRR